MRLFGLTVATLIAFAANSVLNRAALADQAMDPATFTVIRMISGALMLAGIIAAQRTEPRTVLANGSFTSAAALLIYAVTFSFAYVTLDAGMGALVLFGGVQLTMFAGSVLRGRMPGPWHWAGSALGLCGLALLFLPGSETPSSLGVTLMLIAAAAWGIYSLRGQSATFPLRATAANFILAAPVSLLLILVVSAPPTLAGTALAVASGALASGLGYAIWYSVLPRLEASLAAIAQLTVPIIALTGGILFLGERPTSTFGLASTLILGGVALAVLGPRLRTAKRHPE